MRIVAIVQARMGSTRLPGKVLMDLVGEPMLVRVVRRLRRAHTLNEIVVAATVEPADQVIADLCTEQGWPCYRGSQDDVLDRYYQAALQYRADAVVRITSDCPLIDASVVDRVVQEFLARQPHADYVSNTLSPRTFPRGLDTEIMRFGALEQAWRDAAEVPFREHVTLFMYRHPERFRLQGVFHDTDLSGLRWTVDTPEDRQLVQRIYEHFGHDGFSWQEVLELLTQHPEWQEINRGIQQKTV